ncbi:MAG TPA: hypothetical protein VNM14_05520 [Planctomycetota bacterium]|jgi:type II secretory pathway component PulF|nr:hypothetical protein [Planctomycetota bacterium]
MGESAPEPKPRSWGTALYAALSLASLAGILMKIVPQFAEVYRQVKVPMPGATLILVSLSDMACAVPWLVYPLVVVLPVGLSQLNKRTAWRVRAAIGLAYGLSAVGILIAIFLPLMSVHGGIGARRH